MSKRQHSPHHQQQQNDINILLPRLHDAQRRVIAQAKRFNVVCAGRRIGKTFLGVDRLVHPALAGSPVAWMSPTYRMLTEVWRTVKHSMQPLISGISEQQHRISLMTGGVIEMWSLEKADLIRGRKYRRVIIDEAAMVRGLMEAWQQVIRPTLTDMQGDAWMLSTPKGRNFFWECYQRGQSADEPEWQSWQMPTSDNPHIAPEEIAAMRRELPAIVYRQEIEAEFLDTSGGVFNRVVEAATAEPQHAALPGHSYVIGVDWARSGDYSCFVVLDLMTHSMAFLERFTDVRFEIQLGRFRKLCERFQPARILAEKNSLGLPLVEQLEMEGYPIQGMTTTNATKAVWIDGLALAFEQGALRILNDPQLIGELLAFEGHQLEGGKMRYTAPPGQHDDTVMALALAWYGVNDNGPLVLW